MIVYLWRCAMASLDRRFIDGWRAEFLRLWSMRVVAFWGAVFGLILVWPGLASAMPPLLYAGMGVLMCASFAVARFLKQPGTDINA
jgi:hypothetical protein